MIDNIKKRITTIKSRFDEIENEKISLFNELKTLKSQQKALSPAYSGLKAFHITPQLLMIELSYL